MKFFIDTANLDQIKEAYDMGVLDGVTTNPSLMAKEGIKGVDNQRKHYVEICNIVQGDVSAEVIATEYEGMIKEGEELAALNPHIVVKVPCIADGIKAIKYFTSKGIRTNCTLVFSVGQALLAAKGQIMVNLDKAYSIFDDVYVILKKTDTADLVIMKGAQPVETVKREFGPSLDKVIYMPVVTIDEEKSMKVVEDYMEQLHPVAFELCYRNVSSPVPARMERRLAGKSLIWYNTLWASLAGGHDDEAARKDPDASYGYLINKLGARILQTDSPAFMLDYLRSKGWHD